MGSIATISGVALAPGVSRNRRLYTPELIAKAAARMQERLADPNGLPIVMRTHHDAGDDSAKIVGRVTEVTVDDNKALRYKAKLYDTFHAREIANLVTPKEPALRSVSIHGYWMGNTKQVSHEGGMATTADDLEIDAIDFTASPGVDGALIDAGSGKATESGGVYRTPISESIEANVTLVEEGSAWVDRRGRQYELDHVEEAKYSADDMKDLLAKGQAMKNASGEPSYPIADVSDLKKAIKAVGRGKSGHDAIRAHIMKRAKALGATDLIPANWGAGGKMKESAPVRLSEVKEYYPDGPDNPSGFCIDAYSGPLSVTIRGCVSPDELRAAAQMAVCAAMDAICCMDPDDDADIDVGTEDLGDADNMDGLHGESSKGSEAVLTEDAVRDLITQYLADHDRQFTPAAEEAVSKRLDGETHQQIADEMMMHPDDHSHTHEMDGEGHTHAHQHDHVGEGGFNPYSHGHTHTHVHASSDGPSHDHGHNHVHMTSSSATAEKDHTHEEESAVSETTKAAEAAPDRTLTEADVEALGNKIGNTLADALRAFAEMNTPKHAAAPQETTETVEQEVTTESVTKVDTDLTALKESLAKELRLELRNELRAEFLEEKGLPPRRGYRLTENDEPQELSNAELFDKYRAEILLGAYASTPVPDAQAS